MTTTDIKPELVEFLKKENAFVVDAAPSSRRRLIDMMISLGMGKQSVQGYGTFEEVEDNFDKFNPKVIISEFDIGNRSGFDLMQMQRKKIKDQDSIVCILVTANSGQSAVARAAEEEVDGFILKPYTLQSLRKSLIESLEAKLFPSAYYMKIKEGKVLLYSGEIDKSLVLFNQAVSMDPSPTLALYYLAQANFMKEMLGNAENKYEECLKLNNIHYKSLIGLYELLEKQGQSAKAYSIMKKIMEHFPANPMRMSSAIRMAVQTKNYVDIDLYYKFFLNVEPRTDELVRHICSGLVVNGIHYFVKKEKQKAIDSLMNASVSCAGNTEILRKIVEVLVEYDCEKEVPAVLKRFPPNADTNVKVAQLLYALKIGEKDNAYLISQELMKDQSNSISKYNALINFFIKIEKKDQARDIFMDAMKQWPNENSLNSVKPMLFS